MPPNRTARNAISSHRMIAAGIEAISQFYQEHDHRPEGHFDVGDGYTVSGVVLHRFILHCHEL
jgi:hypothetical protein